MITLEETIKICVLTYPTLFGDPYMDPVMWPISRRKVLSHLFLTLGNGYQWYEGCLFDSYGRHKSEALRAIRSGDDNEILKIRKMIAEENAKDHPLNEEGLHDYNESHAEFLKLMGRDQDLFSPYPFGSPKGSSKLGILHEMPKKVQPDYLAGAIEILEDVLLCQLETYGGYSAEDQKKHAAEWIAYLKKRYKLS